MRGAPAAVDEKAWPCGLGPIPALLRGRNRTTAATISEALEADSTPLLSIVGADHVPGLQDLLVQRYGFSLEAPPSR
jgi:hypothetical protein